MSDFYVEKENETTLTLFNKRIIYDFDSQNEKYTNLVNFNFGEKFLYGRVAKNFTPIYLGDGSNLKTFESSITDGSPLQAANFVVDMFDRLATQFDKCMANGKITSDDPFLSSLRIFKAFQNPVELHGSYLQNYLNSLSKELKKSKFTNLEDFMFLLEQRLESSVGLYPITFSGFVKSKLCPISVSGLAIEIADSDYFDDNSKIEEFINSPNWEFYLNACRSYGFMVDKLIPWRLVADIGTSECIEYASQYGFYNTNTVLSDLYYRTDLIFFNKLKFYLLNLYNQNTGTFTETYQCNNDVKVRYVKVDPITVKAFDQKITDERLLQFYMNIRIAEEDKKLTEGQKTKLMKDVTGIYRIQGISRALGLFEKIVNQTFDSPGSLSYVNERNKLREDS